MNVFDVDVRVLPYFFFFLLFFFFFVSLFVVDSGYIIPRALTISLKVKKEKKRKRQTL